jgi:TRAP transporter TAXI family solute receptor
MTPGSVYKVEALRDGELEFALVQSDVAYDAYHGTGAYTEAPFPALRSVLALHSELVTIVARAGIHELSDLAGKRIVAGPAGSGSRATWEAMVKALGWKGRSNATDPGHAGRRDRERALQGLHRREPAGAGASLRQDPRSMRWSPRLPI